MSTKRQRIQNKIATKESQLEKLQSAYSEASIEISSYKFDSGATSQQVYFNKLDKLSKEMRILESEIESLYTQLRGGNLVMIKRRRIL